MKGKLLLGIVLLFLNLPCLQADAGADGGACSVRRELPELRQPECRDAEAVRLIEMFYADYVFGGEDYAPGVEKYCTEKLIRRLKDDYTRVRRSRLCRLEFPNRMPGRPGRCIAGRFGNGSGKRSLCREIHRHGDRGDANGSGRLRGRGPETRFGRMTETTCRAVRPVRRACGACSRDAAAIG